MDFWVVVASQAQSVQGALEVALAGGLCARELEVCTRLSVTVVDGAWHVRAASALAHAIWLAAIGGAAFASRELDRLIVLATLTVAALRGVASRVPPPCPSSPARVPLRHSQPYLGTQVRVPLLAGTYLD